MKLGEYETGQDAKLIVFFFLKKINKKNIKKKKKRNKQCYHCVFFIFSSFIFGLQRFESASSHKQTSKARIIVVAVETLLC